MPRQAARLGDMCTGHNGYPSRPNISGSTDVYFNGIVAHRVGDVWAIHCHHHDCHGGATISGASNVFINNRPAARVGDPVDCGSRIMTGSRNVFIGK